MKVFTMSKDWYQLIIIAVAAYLIGCFNFAKLISKLKKRDITKIGSGNPGTMNMSREFGLKIGVITFFCDAFKGGLPCLIVHLIYRNHVFEGTTFQTADFMRYFCGLCVIIGHIFPVTMGFKGGKGIASTMGLFWFGLTCEKGWLWPVVLALLIGVVIFIFLTEWGSLGSLLGVTVLSIIQAVIFYNRYDGLPVNAYMVCAYAFILAINLLTWAAHRQNILRLFAGEERHTSIKKLSKKK